MKLGSDESVCWPGTLLGLELSKRRILTIVLKQMVSFNPFSALIRRYS